MTADVTNHLDAQGSAQPLVTQVPAYDYSLNGQALEGQDRAILVLGQALERIDPNALINSGFGSAIVQDPRDPAAGQLTVGELVVRLENEFGLSPSDWPGQNTPYSVSNNGSYDFDSVNALIQSLGDHLAADAETIPFQFVRPDSYLVLGDETASDIAHKFGVDSSALTAQSIGSGSVVDLSSEALNSAALTSAERQERTQALFNNLGQRLSTLNSRINPDSPNGYSASYVTDIWGSDGVAHRSFNDYLANVLNPALEQLTGKTLEESVLPYGLGSLYSPQGDFTTESVANLSAAIGRFEVAELSQLNNQAQELDTAITEVKASVSSVVGNITRDERGAFYVDGEQRSVLRIAAEIRLGNIDEEATRSAELLQALNERVEKSALGTEVADLLATLETDSNGNFVSQASLWARGDVAQGTETAFAAGLRALAEEYNVDDPFAAFLPNYELADPRRYSHEDIVALQNAIGAFQDTATRDNERDNLAIQESHTKLNVLLENLNAIIELISKISELAHNIG